MIRAYPSSIHPFFAILKPEVMTKISKDEVARLAHLAGISLSESEIARLETELGEILRYVEQLSELDTEGVTPTYQVTDLEHVTRSDEIIDYGLGRDELLANAPDRTDTQIKVPKVL
ncbi:glutamyl-tRNA(Gln) amidotransferase, C subunit [candidate division TM7 genomosp. GTL1]|nr:glutamyl-tRNA(Gln) amidotransferase, C subunit [candidate division TM7 genomosp. GTL1]